MILYLAGPATGFPEHSSDPAYITDVIDRVKTDDVTLDTDEYVGMVMDLVGQHPTVKAASLSLRDAGHDVILPSHVDATGNSLSARAWAWHKRQTIRALLDADGVALLPGWRSSRSATVVRDLGLHLELDVRPLAGWLSSGEATA